MAESMVASMVDQWVTTEAGLRAVPSVEMWVVDLVWRLAVSMAVTWGRR
jgi:hypothetical protein